jgi:glycosyltransferase involved in cell wall biosynthesis
MSRPAVDVVVPFAGGDADRRDVLTRMRSLALRDGDTVTVVDNGAQAPPADPLVIHAPDRPTSYHARNRGAARGGAEWILFLDADVLAPPDILDRCFAEPVGDRCGAIAGGVRDEQVDDPAALPLPARYAALRAPMSQENTLGHRGWGYAQTANAAFRRSAFEQVGGFEERVRSAGDADLCFRLRAVGWELEYRPEAMVVHRNRTTLRSLLRQRARHGAGSAWVNRRHPGSLPAGPIWRLLRRKLVELARHVRHARWEKAKMAFMDVAVQGAYLAGRLLPNESEPRGS